jgi:EmrB/QacA subfamily drug resistance transporter
MTSTVGAPAAVDEVPARVFGRELPYKYVVAAVYVSALFLDILDVTIVNVAIPSIGREFRSDAAEWIVLGYTLSLAVAIPVSGWLGDRLGTRRVFLAALAAFIAGSALCAAAQSLGQLVAFRVVQGIGGGMLTPVGVAMLFRAFPPIERAKAATFIMIPTLAAPALGPIVGGLLVTHASWHWIFLINIPIGIAAWLFGWRHLREHREASAGRFDISGFVLSGASLALVVYALSEGPRQGWTSPTVVTTALVGVACGVLLVRSSLTSPSPMLDLRLLGNRIFRQCNVTSLFATMSFLGLLFVMPLYLQLYRGLDALHSGLTTFTQALGVLVSSLVAGRLYARIGPRRLMTAGLFAAGLVIAGFTRIGDDTSLWTIRLLMFLRGLCMGFAFVPMQAASYATIRPQDNGRASSIFSTQRQVAVSLGVAILASVLVSFMPLASPPIDRERALFGYHVAFGVAVVFAWLAALAASRIRDEDAAPTMVARR